MRSYNNIIQSVITYRTFISNISIIKTIGIKNKIIIISIDF